MRKQNRSKNFLIVLGISLSVYFVLDYMLNNFMLYLIGGVVGGFISEIFLFFGLNVGMLPVLLIWISILIGAIFLYYFLNKNLLKFLTIIVIAALLYVVDSIIAGIPVSSNSGIQKMRLINNLLIGLIIISKSLILSFIVLFDKKENREENNYPCYFHKESE
mgnify:CR=1 FL=1